MATARFEFTWDEDKAAANRSKHGVAFEDAMAVFRDPLALSVRDDEHSIGEERWITFGESSQRRLLVVIHTYIEIDPDRIFIRIISARAPTRRETRQYREGVEG